MNGRGDNTELATTKHHLTEEGKGHVQWHNEKDGYFQMPRHFPRYTKAQYENMREAELDLLLAEYGIDFKGDLREERKFAMDAFLWS